MANNVIKYITNVTKSFGYTMVDIVGDLNPAIRSFRETNDDFGKEMYASIKDIKGITKKLKKSAIESDVYEFAAAYKKNLFEDLRSGKFYNKERIDNTNAKLLNADEESLRAEFGNIDDFESDFNFDNWSDIDDEDDFTIDDLGDKIASSNAEVTIRSAEYVVAAQKESTKVLYDQQNKIFSQMLNGIATVNSNIGMMSGVPDALQTHVNNSSDFFERTGKSLEETNSLLKQILDVVSPSTEKVDRMRDMDKEITIRDITSNGMPNIKKYANYVKENISNELGSLGLIDSDLLGNGNNALLTLAASPVSTLAKGFFKKGISDVLQKSMTGFNNTLQGFFGSVIAKLNNTADRSDNEIVSKLANIFGLRPEDKNDIDVSNYEKGKVPWDGIARKSLIEVIPGQLAKIVSLLSGKPVELFNYETGRMESIRDVNNRVERRIQGSADMAFSDVRKEMNRYLENITFKNARDKKDFYNSINEFTRYMYENGGMINYNDKEAMEEIGLSSDLATTLLPVIFNQMKKNGKGHLLMNANRKIMTQKSSMASSLRNAEIKGDSIESYIYNQMFDNDIIKDSDSPTGYYEDFEKARSLFNQVDDHGNNVFDYLSGIFKFQEWMVNNWGVRYASNSSIGNRSNAVSSSNISAEILKNPIFENIEVMKESLNALREDMEEREESYNSHDRERKFSNDDKGILFDYNSYKQSKDVDSLEYYMRMIDEVEALEKEDEKRENPKETIMDKINKSEVFGDKFKALAQGPFKFMKAPMEGFAKLLDSANDRMYNFIYGEPSESDEKLGFFELLKINVQENFDKFSDWAKDNVLDPLKEKLGLNDFEDIPRKILGYFGKDYDGIKNNLKDGVGKYLFGTKTDGVRSGGVFGDYIQETKETARDAFGWAKNGLSDVYHNIKDKIPGHAKGATTVEKTGIAAVSKGELIIPSELNPFYHGPTNKKQQIRDEANAVKKFYGSFADGNFTIGSGDSAMEVTPDNILSNIGYTLSDKAAKVVNKEELSRFLIGKIKSGQVPTISRAKSFASYFVRQKLANAKMNNNVADIEGTVIDGKFVEDKPVSKAYNGVSNAKNELSNEFANMVNVVGEKALGLSGVEGNDLFHSITGELGKAAPAMTVGGGIGALAGTLVGGPLLGAAVGASVGIIKKSGIVNEWLFGKQVGDEYHEGLFSQETSKFIKERVPELAKWGLAGTIASAVLPGGPVAGMILGSSVGFAKDSQLMTELLFGEGEEGKDKKKAFEEKVKKALPKMGLGAAAGLIAGPFGLATNVMVGSALGFATSTNTFKEMLLGKEVDGEIKGGLLENFRRGVVDPFKNFAINEINLIEDWIKKDIMDPLSGSIWPITKQLGLIGKGLGGFAKRLFDDRLKNSNFGRWIADSKVAKTARNIAGNAIQAPISLAKGTISLPFKALGSVGNSLKARQIARGNADYLTAEERLQWREDNNLYNSTKDAIDDISGEFSSAGQNFKQGNWARGIGGIIKGTIKAPTKIGNAILRTPANLINKAYDDTGEWANVDKNLTEMSYDQIKELRNSLGDFTDIEKQIGKDKKNARQYFQDVILNDYAIPPALGKRIVKYITSDKNKDHKIGYDLISKLNMITPARKKKYLELAKKTVKAVDDANNKMNNKDAYMNAAKENISKQYSWLDVGNMKKVSKISDYLDRELMARSDEDTSKIAESSVNRKDDGTLQIGDVVNEAKNNGEILKEQHLEVMDQLKILVNSMYILSGNPDASPYANDRTLSITMDKSKAVQNAIERNQIVRTSNDAYDKASYDVDEQAKDFYEDGNLPEGNVETAFADGIEVNADGKTNLKNNSIQRKASSIAIAAENVDENIISNHRNKKINNEMVQNIMDIAATVDDVDDITNYGNYAFGGTVGENTNNSAPDGKRVITSTTALGDTIVKVWDPESHDYKIDTSSSESKEAVESSEALNNNIKRIADSLDKNGSNASGITAIDEVEKEAVNPFEGGIFDSILDVFGLKDSKIASVIRKLGTFGSSWGATMAGPMLLFGFLNGKLDKPISSLFSGIANLLGLGSETTNNLTADGEDGEQSYSGNAINQGMKNALKGGKGWTFGKLFNSVGEVTTKKASNLKGLKKLTANGLGKSTSWLGKVASSIEDGIFGIEDKINQSATKRLMQSDIGRKAMEKLGYEVAEEGSEDVVKKTGTNFIKSGLDDAGKFIKDKLKGSATMSKVMDAAGDALKITDNALIAFKGKIKEWWKKLAKVLPSSIKDKGDDIAEGLCKTVQNNADDALKGASKATTKSGVEAIPVVGWAVTIGFAVADYIEGYNSASTVMGVEDPSEVMKVVAGVVNSAKGILGGIASATGVGIAIGIAVSAIPTKAYVTFFCDTIGKLMNLDINKQRKEYADKIDSYNEKYGTDYDTEKYEKNVKGKRGWFDNLKLSFKEMYTNDTSTRDSGLDKEGNIINGYVDESTTRWKKYYAPKIQQGLDREYAEILYINECLHDSDLSLTQDRIEEYKKRIEEYKSTAGAQEVPTITNDLNGIIRYGRVQTTANFLQKAAAHTGLFKKTAAQKNVDYGNGINSDDYVGSYAYGGAIPERGYAALSKGELRITDPSKFFGSYATGGIVGNNSGISNAINTIFGSFINTKYSTNKLIESTDVTSVLNKLSELDPSSKDWTKYWEIIDESSKNGALHPMKSLLVKMAAMLYMPIYGMQTMMATTNQLYDSTLSNITGNKTGTTNATTSVSSSVSTIANNSTTDAKSNSKFTLKGAFNKAVSFAKGLFGGGSGTPDTFISQMNSNSNYGDSSYAEEGCAPATAAMLINKVGGNTTTMEEAGEYAVSHGYKVKGDGTKNEFFKDIFNSKGIDSENVSDSKQVIENLKNGKPTVILGQDSQNKSKKDSPFGKNPHYILATGLDNNGNIVVNDPEADKGGKTYKPSILNKMKTAISTKIAGGRSGLYGGASDVASQVWYYLTQNGFTEQAAAGVMGNLKQETGMNPACEVSGVTCGIACWDYQNGKSALKEAAKKANVDWKNLGFQLDYLLKGLPYAFNAYTGKSPHYYKTGEWCWWPKKMTFDEFKALTSINDATEIFERVYERASKPNMSNRIKYANEYYKQFTGKEGEPITYNASTSASTSSTESSSTSSQSTNALDAVFNKVFSRIYGEKNSKLLSLLGFGNGIDDSSSNESVSPDTNTTTGTAVGSSDLGNAVAAEAPKYVGGKYVWGGNDLNKGVDCSGFVTQLYKKHGYNIPNRQSKAMFTDNSEKGGKTITGSYDPSKLQPGDAMFFSNNGQASGVHHVGLYVGNNHMIHAQSTKTGIVNTDMAKSSYKNTFVGAKRYASETGSGSGLVINKNRMITPDKLFGRGSKSQEVAASVGSDNISVTSNTIKTKSTTDKTNALVKTVSNTLANTSVDYTKLLTEIIGLLTKLVANTNSIATIANLVSSLAGGNNTTTNSNSSNEIDAKNIVELMTALASE